MRNNNETHYNASRWSRADSPILYLYIFLQSLPQMIIIPDDSLAAAHIIVDVNPESACSGHIVTMPVYQGDIIPQLNPHCYRILMRIGRR